MDINLDLHFFSLYMLSVKKNELFPKSADCAAGNALDVSAHRRAEYPVVGRAFPGPALLVGSA